MAERDNPRELEWVRDQIAALIEIADSRADHALGALLSSAVDYLDARMVQTNQS